MKFELQNLGTIKKTTLDLRPLTVIVGPNNSSKTYLAYCVHGLIQALERRAERGRADYESRVDLDSCHTLNVSDILRETRKVVREVAGELTKDLAEFFQDTHGKLFHGSRVSAEPTPEEVRACLVDVASGLDLDGKTVKIEGGEGFAREAAEIALAGIVHDIVGSLLGTVLTLPAERNALVITYKMLSTRRFRVLRDRQRALSFDRHREVNERERSVLREQGDIRYPGPIEDFLDFLTDVELRAARPKNDARDAFGRLAKAIEAHLQGGHRTSFEATKLGGSELALIVSDKLLLDIYNASSSIKQVAPLLLYLRYRAARNQTLIIDEPEMNLHPEGQAKLLEALAMLANLGVRVLVTTHSPYFMAHLNNLIASDPTSAARKKRQAKHLYMGDPAAFLSPEDVSAYEMRPEGLHSLADAEYGIRWDTLSDVSSELQRRYFAILEEPKGRAKAK